MTLALGIDLGGTKIEIIGLDERGAVLLRRRRPSPRGSYAATLAAIRAWCAEAEAELGARGTVGFGTPGAISPATGLLKNSNSTWLNGKPLDRDLAALLERPIALANDADCLALSEATDGAAAGAATRVRGDPRHRRRRRPRGPWPGARRAQRDRRRMGPQPAALAGRRRAARARPATAAWPAASRPGCPGPGLARDYRAATGVAARAAGDRRRRGRRAMPAAEAALRRYEQRLARGLAAVINLLDPAGDRARRRPVSSLSACTPAVPALWHRYVFSDTVRTPLLPADARRLLRGARRRLARPQSRTGPAGLTVRAREHLELLQRGVQLEVAVVEHQVAQITPSSSSRNSASNLGVSDGFVQVVVGHADRPGAPARAVAGRPSSSIILG